MTFSVLARDPETGALGAAAATGNLCVGAWVLRGDARWGMSASQGHSPSTLWGEDSLALLSEGMVVADVVARVVEHDPGQRCRQLAVLGRDGSVAGFDGPENQPYTGHLAGSGWIVTGNWLGGREVIERAADGYQRGGGDFARRLIAALRAGIEAGSDRRGVFSAALLVLSEDAPPLDLRVDLDAAPVDRLEELLARTQEPAYHEWLATLPTRREPGKS